MDPTGELKTTFKKFRNDKLYMKVSEKSLAKE
jgi:hypothetical protein